MSAHYTATAFFRVSIFLLACVLVFSFGLHTLDTHHSHPGYTDSAQEHHRVASVISEYAHMGENKILFIVTSIFLLGCGGMRYAFPLEVVARASISATLLCRSRDMRKSLLRLETYLFAHGILHPKVF